MAKNIIKKDSVVGDSVTVDENGMVRLGGVPLFRVVESEGVVYIEVKDRMRPRCEARGSAFVYGTATTLIEAILNLD